MTHVGFRNLGFMNLCPVPFLLCAAAGKEVEKTEWKKNIKEKTAWLEQDAECYHQVEVNEATVPDPHLPKRQSFTSSCIGHHLGAQIFPTFLRLGVILPLCERYKGLLCSGRKCVTWLSQKPWLPLICDPGKTMDFQKERCDLCNSFFTAVIFQGNQTVMSFPCF